MPPNQPLDLFVTVTDFQGYRQRLNLHDPPEIEEQEHRLILSFRHHRSNAVNEVGFGDDALPGLVFAARATSCFPGAFPPTRLAEIDRLVYGSGRPWPQREAFIRKALGAAGRDGRPVERISFIDGSVLNNKPFGPAIDALPSRVAHRQVDRRIVYVDPAPPRSRTPSDDTALPGFLRVITGALSVIPRNQPVRDELERLNAISQETRSLREVVEAARPTVTATIERLLGPALRRRVTEDMLADWRDRAHAKAQQSAGYAYEGYLQLKIVSVLRHVAEALAKGCEMDVETAETGLRRWAETTGVFPRNEEANGDPWVAFLQDFDVTYRIRRLRFVIRRINELYQSAGAPTPVLDGLKGALYRHHSTLRHLMEHHAALPADQATLDETMMTTLAARLDLAETDTAVDRAIAQHLGDLGKGPARRDILTAYLGFEFFDTITFPITRQHNIHELDEVLVDRISPEDATTLSNDEGRGSLKGTAFGHFGAFFSRAYREHDYLWGRLHGAERLVDIVASAAEASGATVDRAAIKRRLFRSILEREAPRLTHIRDVTGELKAFLEMP